MPLRSVSNLTRSLQAFSNPTILLQVVTSLCLLAGIWQTAFSLLGLGKLSWILSDVLVSGYTTAAAIHVVVSQLKGVFGITPAPSGNEASFFRFKIYNVSET